MVNFGRLETKEFINDFASNPKLCGTVLERLNVIFCDRQGKGSVTGFYLYPSKKNVKSKFQILVKRQKKKDTWSFVIIEQGKANQNTYKNNLNVEQTLQAILDVLEEEGDTYGC